MLKMATVVLSLIADDATLIPVAEFGTTDQCSEVLLHMLHDANCSEPSLAPRTSIIPEPRPEKKQ